MTGIILSFETLDPQQRQAQFIDCVQHPASAAISANQIVTGVLRPDSLSHTCTSDETPAH
jgi:hypothetical protein